MCFALLLLKHPISIIFFFFKALVFFVAVSKKKKECVLMNFSMILIQKKKASPITILYSGARNKIIFNSGRNFMVEV